MAETFPQRFERYSGCQVSEKGLSRYAIPTQAGVAQRSVTLGSRTVSLLLRLNLLFSLLPSTLLSSLQVYLFLPGWVIKSTEKDTCCGHSFTTALCTIHP